MSKSVSFDIDINSSNALEKIYSLYEAYQNGAVNAGRKLNDILGGEVKKTLVWEARTVVEGGEEVKKLVPTYKEVFTAVDQIEKKTKELNKVQAGSVTSLRQQVNEAKQQRDAIAKIKTTTDEYGKSVQAINPQWAAANEKVKTLEGSLAKATGDLLGLAKVSFPGLDQILKFADVFGKIGLIIEIAVGAFQALNQAFEPIVQRNKQIEGLKLSLTSFTGSAETANDVLGSAKNIALTYGVSLETVEKAYKRLTPAILASGGTVKDAEASITALSARTVALGLNTEQAGRYQEAFAQVLGKGKLQSEELNQQFSELDGALRSQLAAYVEAKYGIEDFNEAMRNGEITANIFREAFVAISQDMVIQLAGGVNEVSARINELGQAGGTTVQQLENIRGTLGAIATEGFGKTFAELGKSVEAVKTQFSQFFAAFATNLPTLSSFFGNLFGIIGRLVELIIGGFLVALQGTLWIIDKIAQGLGWLTGLGPTLEKILPFLDVIVGRFREGYDITMQLGESVNTSAIEIQTAGQKAEELAQKFRDGKITLAEYEAGVKQIGTEIDKNVEKAGQQYQQDLDKLAELKVELNKRYDEETQRLQDLIGQKEEVINAEKAKTAEIIEQIRADYAERKQLLDDELVKVNERYAAEIDALQELTPAEEEQLRLRRAKLEAVVASADATYEERVNAQASLDAMDRQAQIADVRKSQEQDINKIKGQQADLEKQQTNDIQTQEQLLQERTKAERAAIQEYKTAIAENKQRQEEMNKLIDAQLVTQGKQIDAIQQTEKAVKEQIVQVNNSKTAYENAKKEAEKIKKEINDALAAQKLLNQEAAKFKYPPPPPSNRFAGGPVTGGQRYTVNEFGREAFLSAAGHLTELRTPAWGTWRAPSSGTIIPADVYAQIKGGMASRSPSGAINPALYGSGGSGLSRLLMGLSGGSQDRITNNVSIQAVNPTQAASDLLVQLTKLRRLRYS